MVWLDKRKPWVVNVKEPDYIIHQTLISKEQLKIKKKMIWQLDGIMWALFTLKVSWFVV